MTYQTAYNKIIDAYFKDEIKPYDNKFCFCGTLAVDDKWRYEIVLEYIFMTQVPNPNLYPYTIPEYIRMEKALLTNIMREMDLVGDIFDPMFCNDDCIDLDDLGKYEGYEDALFAGMSKALDELKQIHIERGEVIDETPVFTKRQLV